MNLFLEIKEVSPRLWFEFAGDGRVNFRGGFT